MPPPAHRNTPTVRRIPVFIVIALALMMMSIDATIVATALHALQQDLGAPINWTGWTVTAYWLGYVVMLPVSGRLSERLGHRRVFLFSCAAFALASLLCGLAPNIYWLVLCRALQAAGGAGLTPAATGIIVRWFGNERDRALGLFGAVFPIGALVGPVFGGFFVTYLSWRDVFFVNVPTGLLMALLDLWLIPPDRASERSQASLDLPGMALMGMSVVCGMWAIGTLGNASGRILSWSFALPMLVALAAGRAFFMHIARVPQPFLAPRLIHGRGFGATNLLNAVYAGTAMGSVTLVPLYATTRYGLNALDAGTLLIAQGLAALVLSTLAAWLLRKTGYRLPFCAGGLLVAAGLLLLAPAPRFGLTPWAWLSLATTLVGAGVGFMGPASRNAALQLVPERASTMAALRATAQECGVIVSLSVMTAILAGRGQPATTLAVLFVACALISIGVLPVVRRVPEHYGRW